MNFGGIAAIARRAERLVASNSPAILTAIGVTGTVATAVLTGKATLKAVEILDEEGMRRSTQLDENGDFLEGEATFISFNDIVKLTWKCYIPAACCGALTIAAIICANRIGVRRAAALASALTLSEKAYEEFREKAREKMGDDKVREIREDILRERLEKQPPQNLTIIGQSHICYDSRTGRTFASDMESLRAAENQINYLILHDGYAALTDFYDQVGLPPTGDSDFIGWNADKLLRLEYDAVIHEGIPVISVTFSVQPFEHYHRFG